MDMNLITNNLDLGAPVKSIIFPMTPWQVYELGLMINNMIEKIYHLLAENCTDQEVVFNMLKHNQTEADTLKERITLHQNCEMLDYYGSRGRFRHTIEGEVDQTIRDNFDNEVKIFSNQFDHLLDTIKQQKIPFSNEEVRNLSMNVNNDICDFYQTILDFYPQGETNDAVKDIYNLTHNYYYARLQ